MSGAGVAAPAVPLSVERAVAGPPDLQQAGAGLVLARVAAHANPALPPPGTRVLARLDGGGDAADAGVVAPLPDGLGDALVPFVPVVARALAFWDALGLEIGETAIVTSAGWTGHVVATVASWYGAAPLVVGMPGLAAGPPGSDRLIAEDAEAAVKDLQGRLQGRAGVAGVELTGRAALVDLLLQTVPTFARLMFAGDARERLTVDFYVNVHRKGLLLHSDLFDPAAAVAAPWTGGTGARFARAARLLARPDRAAACLGAVGQTAPAAAPA
jgi:hypothetical protein